MLSVLKLWTAVSPRREDIYQNSKIIETISEMKTMGLCCVSLSKSQQGKLLSSKQRTTPVMEI